MEFFKPSDSDYRDVCGITFKDGKGFGRTDGLNLISLDKANRLLLEKGTAVYGVKDKFTGLLNMNEQPGASDTHSALLINIEPIERDSAESLLRDIITAGSLLDIHTRESLEGTLKRFYDRARKLLAKERP